MLNDKTKHKIQSSDTDKKLDEIKNLLKEIISNQEQIYKRIERVEESLETTIEEYY